MRQMTFILGGARSGKSDYAQKIAAQRSKKVLFLATAEAGDLEMAERISRHRANRPETWHTLEAPRNIEDVIIKYRPSEDLILLDCLTLLVSNILMGIGDNLSEDEAWQAVIGEIDGLMNTHHKLNADWIIVSNEVGLGLVPPYPLGRMYRDVLGKVNQLFAAEADEVIFMVSGLPLKLK